MDFNVPEELKMVQSMVRDFVTDQLKPLERDLLGRAADLSDARASLPPQLEEKLVAMVAEIGLWGINVPEDLGGPGIGTLGNCLVEEELAQTPIPFRLGDVSPVLFDCSADQREKYLRPLLDGQRSFALGFLEPGLKAASNGMQTTALKSGEGYLLNGTKLTFSRLSPDKDWFAAVFAQTDAGPTCFLVDNGIPGFDIRMNGVDTGWRSGRMDPVSLEFRDCSIPVDNLLGEAGKAFHLGERWLPGRRLVRSARCIGVAQRLLEEATIQAQNWQSFGQVLTKRPLIEAALADIAIGIHAARLMVYEAGWKADEGQPVKREASMVKIFTSELVCRAADRVTQVFNGPPHVAGLPMEKFCHHALVTSTNEHSLELQRSIVVRDILKGLRA